jgi:hypothetical protein
MQIMTLQSNLDNAHLNEKSSELENDKNRT